MAPSKDFQILAQVMRFSPDVLCAIDSKGLIQAVNAAFLQVLRYEEVELLGNPFTDIVHPDDRPAALHMAAGKQAEAVEFECRCVGRAGQEIVLAWSVFPAPADELLLCASRNVTAERQAARQAQAQAELNEVLVQYGFDMVGLMNEEGIYTYLGGSIQATLGYGPSQLLQHNAFDYIHPEDLHKVQACWQMLSTHPVVSIADFRFRAANGEWKWVETSIRNQTQNPAIGAYVVSSRDITERKQSAFEREEREQRFRLLFENNLSLAVFQGTTGVVLDMNPAFLAFLKQPKQAVVGKQLIDFMPVEVRDLFN